MPFLIWEMKEQATTNHVETDWLFRWTPEELREEAEVLDRELDAILDSTLERVEQLPVPDSPREFVTAWAIGQAINDAKVFEAPQLENERAERLWKALASKCRTGLRSTGAIEHRWVELRPSGARRPRREGMRLDYFDMCVWLAAQDFPDAEDTFGGHVRNVWQMLERRTLNSYVVRATLLRWLRSLPPSVRASATAPKNFAEMMKALRARWPDRGAGSAKRPFHYTDDGLFQEMSQILKPFAARTRV